MKNNKLFNKVLSKSAMLLIIAGITMNSGTAFNIYAQDVAATNATEAAQASTTDTTSADTSSTTVADETAVAQARCIQPVYQGFRPNVTITVRPSRPNTNCPNKPETDTPNVDKPETDIPSVDKPETDTPSVDKPETDTPSVDKPEADTPSVDKPETDAPSVDEAPSEEVSNQTAFENEVLRLVNVERAKQGLNPLQMDESIRNVARIKATDMYKNNYFSHTSPTYGSPFDMLKQYGISYKSAAENIAQGQTTPAQVVNGWMNSSGHRANILNASYTHIGIGYEKNGNQWVQMFVGK